MCIVLCEKEGVICGGNGYCGVGGVCVCNSTMTGEFCDVVAPPSTAPRRSPMYILITLMILIIFQEATTD